MAKVYIEDYEMQDIADAIREKSENKEGLLPSEMPQAILDIQTGGGSDVYRYLSGASFVNVVFPQNYELVVELPLFCGGTGTLNFQNATGLKSIKAIAPPTSRDIAWYANGAFRTANGVGDTLKIIDRSEFSKRPSNIGYLVAERRFLEEIIGELDLSGLTTLATNNAFIRCYGLKEIRFKKESIPSTLSFAQSNLLTDESKQSIIEGLANLFDLGLDSQTVTFHPDVVITTEQRQQALDKNWIIEGGKTE